MKISFNPSNSNKNILDLIKNNKDIIFDLKGHSIFARGVEFKGTDTNTWRDIKINNVSIGSHTLDLRNGSNTTLTNTNGVVTINSTWRPVVDNLTSDSTTSSLSAKQGKVLKTLIDGKSNSDHNHDGRYLKLTGGTMTSNALITFADSGSWDTDEKPQGARGGLYWTGQSDYVKLYAEETAGDNLDLVIQFGDDNSNGLSIRNKANTQTSYISSSGVITTGTFKGNLDWSYITNKPATATRWPSWAEVTGKPSSFTPSTHTHGLSNSVFFLNMPSINGNAKWKEVFGYPVNYNLLLSVRINNPAPEWCVGNFGSGILYGGSDTKGFMSSAYNEPFIMWAGGNGSSDDSVPKWYIGIKGTHKSIYNLATIASEANAAYNLRHSHANKSVLDGITSGLVNSWNTAYNFVSNITGTDTDKVINKWEEIVNFLAGITEDNKLNTLLNSKLSVYELADKTNVGTIKNNGIYYSTTDASSSTLTNSPFNNGFALINMTSYDGGDDLRRSRLAFNAYGEIKVSDDRGQSNTAETWYNVLTSKNSGINGSTIKLNGTSITVYSSGTADGRYVKKSGDTMQGVLTIDTTNFGTLTIKRNDDANGASIQFRGKSSVYGYIGLNNSTKDKQFLRWSSDTSRIYTILDTSSTYISNGKGVINGTTITQVDNATNSTNSTNARKLVNWYSARPTSLNAQFGDGSLRIFYATSSTTEGKPAEDSHILHLAWDNTGGYDAQLAVHARSGKVSTRAQNGGTWQPWKTLAFITDIPTSLKNPYSFNVFGVVYDGSAAKTVTTSTFISQVTEGTSTITDGTMLITSYASNSGFADTNAANVPYKRKAIHLWEYIKTKTDSLYATKNHNHDDRYVRAFGTSNDNIDSDWGQSFKTFDPIPSGTPPEQNPNISLLSIGENFNRRKQLAFIWNNDNIYYRRRIDSGFTNWRRLAFVDQIPTSLKNPYALTISLNGTSQGPYDGSVAKNINITPSSIGAAVSNHSHDYLVVNSADDKSFNSAYHNFQVLYAGGGNGITGKPANVDAFGLFKFRAASGWSGQMLLANGGSLYIRSSEDAKMTNTLAWKTILDSSNYSGILDSRYYTESEVNSLLSRKLDRVNLTTGSWNPRGWNLAADYHYNGGDLSISENNGKMYVSVDGCFWQNEGQYRVLDTSDIGDIRNSVTLHQYLSATDVAWYPLVWGGNAHYNTSDSTGAVYKSYDKLSWQTSSQTLYATNIQTNNIKNLSIGGGIYWNPNVESASDGSDAASITLVRSGVAGGTTLVLSQQNDTNDTIQFKTNTAARLYHNSYPILTTQNTYVNNNKGYINGTEITQVNNSDTLDNWHKDNIQWTGYITSSNSLSSYWFKMYQITVTGYQYNDITITFLVSEGYSKHFSIFHLKIRQNGTNHSGNYNLGVELRELVGNLRDRVVAYYNNSTGDVQLWGNPNGQYNTMNYTVLKKTTRIATDSSSLGILTAQSFSSVQTPPSTGYTRVTMARVGSVSYSDSTGSVHWNNVTNKPSTFNPAAHTHTVFKNNLMIKGTNGISDSASIHLGIGDSDTGFKWISDGVCQIYANNVAVGQWTSGGMNWFKNPTVNGNKVWNAGNDGSGSGLDADTLDGYHAASFVKMKQFRFNQYKEGFWTKILTITINSTSDLQPVIAFNWIPSECAREVWAEFTINWRSNSPIFYAIWKGTAVRTLTCVNSSGNIWNVWVQGDKNSYDPFGEVQVTYAHNISSYNGGSLGYSDSDPGGTRCTLGGYVNYARSTGNADTLDGEHASSFVRAGHYESNDLNKLDTYSFIRSVNSNVSSTSPKGNTGWYNVIQLVHRNGASDGPSYIGQIALGMTTNTNDMFFRGKRTDPWKTVIHSGNYTEFINNYYWANVKISTSSSTTTSPTVSNLTATNSIRLGDIHLEHTNEINSYRGLLINYRSSADVDLCQGGGNVCIGATLPTQKLDVRGNIITKGLGIQPYYLSKSVLLPTIRLDDGYTYKCLEISATTEISCIIADRAGLMSERGILIKFNKGYDGQIILLKDLQSYGSGNGYFWVMPSGCKIISADNSSILVGQNQISNTYDDGRSRFLVYSSVYSVWIEFLCSNTF